MANIGSGVSRACALSLDTGTCGLRKQYAWWDAATLVKLDGCKAKLVNDWHGMSRNKDGKYSKCWKAEFVEGWPCASARQMRDICIGHA
ncbi:hypothetical protein HAX54_023475, partial [Datura stramonium]|nr:hypothetical protein [Datura stramonium]